jgi:hypothetical protein
MAATLKDIIFMLKTEPYNRERFGAPTHTPIKRSVIDWNLTTECPSGTPFTEVLLHCLRPVKKRS